MIFFGFRLIQKNTLWQLNWNCIWWRKDVSWECHGCTSIGGFGIFLHWMSKKTVLIENFSFFIRSRFEFKMQVLENWIDCVSPGENLLIRTSEYNPASISDAFAGGTRKFHINSTIWDIPSIKFQKQDKKMIAHLQLLQKVENCRWNPAGKKKPEYWQSLSKIVAKFRNHHLFCHLRRLKLQNQKESSWFFWKTFDEKSAANFDLERNFQANIPKKSRFWVPLTIDINIKFSHLWCFRTPVGDRSPIAILVKSFLNLNVEGFWMGCS